MSIVIDGYSYIYFNNKLTDFKLYPYENFSIQFIKQLKPINDVIIVMDIYNKEGYIISKGAGTYSDYVANGTNIVAGCLGYTEHIDKIRICLAVPFTIEEINKLIANKLLFRFNIIDQECFKFDLIGNVYLK